jgi:AraC-like DNA-binding protein
LWYSMNEWVFRAFISQHEGVLIRMPFLEALISTLDSEWKNLRVIFAEPWEIPFVVPAGERNDYEIHFVEYGKGLLTVGGHEYVMEAGDIVMLYSMEGNSYTVINEPCRFMFVTFEIQDAESSKQVAELNAQLHEGRFLRLPSPDSVQGLMYQIYREMSIKRKGSAFRCKLLLAEMVAEIDRQRAAGESGEVKFVANNNTQKLVNRVVIYLQENYMRDISLKDLGNLINLHPRYLCTLFRQVTGKTLNEFLRDIRLRKAQKLLLYTSLDITEIALQVGFNSSQYFSRVFSHEIGSDPRTFRKSKRSIT